MIQKRPSRPGRHGCRTISTRSRATTPMFGGSRVHYVDEGSGPPLLLLHGNPTWSFLYRNIITGLRDRYRCLAVDYPGFGLSSAAPGYAFTPAEHADVLELLVGQLDI